MNAGDEVAHALPLITLAQALQNIPGVEAWLVSPAQSAPHLIVRNTAPRAFNRLHVSVFELLFVWPDGCAPCASAELAARAIFIALNAPHEPGHRDVRAGCAIRCLGLDENTDRPLHQAGLRTIDDLLKVARKGGLRDIRKIGVIRAVHIHGALLRAGFTIPPP
ncbi:hypothetical protein [Actinomadura macrotermitis]|uniref:RNA polymerase alpha subunit C-terminal domain-containing protein n=1 Tax=Actinomadura macrotermitis TaxID=2585200 RepID=A0A7K0BQK7_9ACTN|nr:hypothetical protein [Actinomadura macrotermitis]MQY03449.1 hypothetical protein [Actinomadura macrotermitis]